MTKTKVFMKWRAANPLTKSWVSRPENIMNFGKIDNLILFGGSRILVEFALKLKEENNFKFVVFSSKRHLEEAVKDDGLSLQDILKSNDITFFSSSDINQDENVDEYLTESTLGIAFGATWVFEKDLVKKFDEKLLDFMGINLPRFRGGAHYTWQVLMQNKVGCCNLQIIHGGTDSFHKGEIIKSKSYHFPNSARMPIDYFNAAVKNELLFLEKFLKEIKQQEDFNLVKLDESLSTYFPFLYTKKHGFINWNWSTEDIELFICAFDDPYAGASTFINGKRVHLKKCSSNFTEGPFHPFQIGLVFRKNEFDICVATIHGALIIKEVFDEKGKEISDSINVGDRFYTPQKYLEEAMLLNAVYDSKGVKEKKK